MASAMTGIADDFAPVIQRQLRGEERGFVDRSFLEQLAQILRLGGGELAHAHVIQDDQIGLGELVAVAQVRAAGAGEREVLQPGGERHVQHRLAAGTGVQARGLGDEGLADAGLADQQHRAGIVQPLQAVEFLDLRLGDRATGGEVDVLERRAQGELGGFDAVAGLALLAIIGFGLQQRIEELAVAGLVARGVGDEPCRRRRACRAVSSRPSGFWRWRYS